MIDAKDKLKGIYAITPPKFDETKLLNDINICLSCGVKIFQIRYKEEITIELKDFFSVLVKRIKKKEGAARTRETHREKAQDAGATHARRGEAHRGHGARTQGAAETEKNAAAARPRVGAHGGLAADVSKCRDGAGRSVVLS